VTTQNDSKGLMVFMNAIGNLVLPGSSRYSVPAWGMQDASPNFLAAIEEFKNTIETFQVHLQERYNKSLEEFSDRDLQVCILENSEPTRKFFETFDIYFIADYYARPNVLTALGIQPGAPFPRGSKMFSGNLEILEDVFNRGKLYKE
jgi:hypothetical protein